MLVKMDLTLVIHFCHVQVLTVDTALVSNSAINTRGFENERVKRTANTDVTAPTLRESPIIGRRETLGSRNCK